ncbi:MAG: tryptophan--tRNA ligase [Candidatus Methanophagaceae archaeon]|nr:MAG: tryptophan--tRNA ligase [Methanophagales archaeon]
MVGVEIDPWGVGVAGIKTKDYTRLFEEFGISPFKELLNGRRSRIKKPHLYMRRGVIVGHRGYEEVLRAMQEEQEEQEEERRKFAVMSGFMPSGRIHLGGKMVMDEIIWHQQRGGDAFACIADLESHSVRGVPWSKCKEVGVNEYILSLVALGFDPERGHIYFQSENRRLQDLAFELGTEVNFSELSAIYGFSGEVCVSHLTSVVVQNADILQPQLPEYGGPKPVVIPVGVDQDPHIRLTRDIASRMRMFRVEKRRDKNQKPFVSVRQKQANKAGRDALEEVARRTEGPKKIYEMHLDIFGVGAETGVVEDEIDRRVREVEETVRAVELEFGGYGFFLPSATYHKFMQGLTGGKMSSSVPESYIALTEPPEEAARKVKRAKTGGRVTVAEQKRLGGSPEECTVFELLVSHLVEEDARVQEIFEACKDGRRVCSACKSEAAEQMFSFIKRHQEERERAKEVLREHEIYKEWL